MPANDLYDDDAELKDLLSDDSNDDSDNPFLTPTSKQSWSPENVALLLPSILGSDVCNNLGFRSCAIKEKQMCIGQANNALQGLRMSLSRKAILF